MVQLASICPKYHTLSLNIEADMNNWNLGHGHTEFMQGTLLIRPYYSSSNSDN